MSAPALRLQGDLWIGDSRLVQGLEITAPAGRWTCLLGPSGVGKSTLGRLVAGLPGRARLEGDATAVRGGVSMLAQQDQMLPWASALQNVTLGARLRGAPVDHFRARDLLDRVGLAGLHQRRPATLSGGQRQRVALARTLIEDCPVVVLDEPFSALDAGTRMEMQDLAARLLAGRTVLLITHDPLEAARLGHAAFLMTAQGSRPVELPDGPAPRAVSDPAVTAAQAKIFGALSQSFAA